MGTPKPVLSLKGWWERTARGGDISTHPKDSRRYSWLEKDWEEVVRAIEGGRGNRPYYKGPGAFQSGQVFQGIGRTGVSRKKCLERWAEKRLRPSL